jgi:hypothetical protein
LYLFVTAKRHRSWRMKYRFAGKERRLREGRDTGIEAVKVKFGRAAAAVMHSACVNKLGELLEVLNKRVP